MIKNTALMEITLMASMSIKVGFDQEPSMNASILRLFANVA